MSDAGREVKFTLKVMINKEKNKVLFAESDSHFADVLLGFLTLPLGKILRTMEIHHKDEGPTIGSLTSLYKSLSNLDSLQSSVLCDLLNPKTSYQTQLLKLKPNIGATPPPSKPNQREDSTDSSQRKKFKIVVNTPKGSGIARVSSAQVQATNHEGNGDCDVGVITANTSSFVISDDLRIAPVVPGAIVGTLMNVGITDTDNTELMTVTFGLNEIRQLLKGCLVSETPLTDIILRGGVTRNCPAGDLLLHKMVKRTNSRKMVLKAMVQRSTNKLVLAQADEGFIEFLFSFLTIPLGAVECLLGGKSNLKNIDNLYKSVEIIDDSFLKTRTTKPMLLKPKIDSYVMLRNQILPLVEEGLCPHQGNGFTTSVMRRGVFNVTDDLTVMPFCLTSTVSVLNSLKVPLTDIHEVEWQIGVEEAVNILKASLTSTSALTDALINPLLKKQTKQEH